VEATEAEFCGIVGAIVTRFFGQNGRSPPAAEAWAAMATRLVALVRERGCPGAALTEAEVAVLTARVLGETADPLWADAVRQLVKACFYPPLVGCRDSFREVTREGVCRRQQLERVRGRISGTHCVDCPHWTSLEAGRHVEFLTAEWRMEPAVLTAHREIFLPEDFRALRRWLQAAR
jgi:hypothetical protein